MYEAPLPPFIMTDNETVGLVTGRHYAYSTMSETELSLLKLQLNRKRPTHDRLFIHGNKSVFIPSQQINRLVYNLLFGTLAGDEVICINGRQVEGLGHQEVVTLFREVRRGSIVILAGRKLPKDKDGLYVTAEQLAQTQLPLV